MILFADSEGPDQTAQTDLGLRCPHMPKDMFLLSEAQSMKVIIRTENHDLYYVTKTESSD